MERKGAFFTPHIWAQKAQDYLAQSLGENWQDEYYIWDCAAGTGNLLLGAKNPARVFASTLDLSDVLIMQELRKIADDSRRLPLLEGHIFQFDFLNDGFEKLPSKLQKIIQNEPEKLVIFINPPYAEVSSYGEKGKARVNLSNTHTKYKDILTTAGRELFAQFFMRIYKEIPNCILASFSTLKYINGSAFLDFRKEFKAKFLGGFAVPADTFDNVKGQFPIGFLIWNLKEKESLSAIQLDIFNDSNANLGRKGFYVFEKSQFINAWIGKFKDDKCEKIGFLAGTNGNDFQHNQIVYFLNSKSQMPNPRGIWLNAANLIPSCVYFAMRQAIKQTWLNDRDQFLSPNSGWENDAEFQNDCLAFALFHGQNKISSKHGVNHFIPFREVEVGAREAFESNFMWRFIKGKCAQNSGDLVEIVDFIPRAPLKFSAEADAVFAAGCLLWKYYHACENPHPNASLYDIKEFFQGRNERGVMNPPHKASDENYRALLESLKIALEILAEKITPKIYEFGFLRE